MISPTVYKFFVIYEIQGVDQWDSSSAIPHLLIYVINTDPVTSVLEKGRYTSLSSEQERSNGDGKRIYITSYRGALATATNLGASAEAAMTNASSSSQSLYKGGSAPIL